MEIKYVNVNDIVIPKVRFRSSGNEELIESFKSMGVLEPIIVCFDEME